MERQSFSRRFIIPVFIIFIIISVAFVGYSYAWRLGSPFLHHLLASLLGPLYFLLVAFGPLFVYPVAYFRGASPKERVIASLINPFLWMTKECIRLYASFTLLECLYFYLNLLNIWLILGLGIQIGVAELLCRKRLKGLGRDIQVFDVRICALLGTCLLLFVLMYACGEGEGIWSVYLEGYRRLFHSGV